MKALNAKQAWHTMSRLFVRFPPLGRDELEAQLRRFTLTGSVQVFFIYLCAQAYAPLHATLETESGCTMEVVCSGSQHRQDPQVWVAELSPDRAKKPKTACHTRSWSLGWTPDKGGSPQNRFFDSLVGRLVTSAMQILKEIACC